MGFTRALARFYLARSHFPLRPYYFRQRPGHPCRCFCGDLTVNDIKDTQKWVDDFVFFRYPITSHTSLDGATEYTYAHDLDTIISISEPLGIVWNDLSAKGHDFGYITEYTGFTFDVAKKRVYLSEKKRLKYLGKVSRFLAAASAGKVKLPAVRSIHGTLQHVSFVYRDGRSFLPALNAQISHFPNDFVSHNLSSAARNDLDWWERTLSLQNVSRSLLVRSTLDSDIWVDASTDFGIGILVDGHWAAWKLLPGWKSDGRDIGWAESVAIELACSWFCSVRDNDFLDKNVVIHGDNTSVIDAYKRGRSRNVPRNMSIRRITEMLIPRNLSISPIYVPSAENLADLISRGDFGPQHLRLNIPFSLNDELSQFIVLCTG
jgi:hypothetical protein